MWDYDKLFAEGNIVGFKNEVEGRFGVYQITKDKELPREARYYNFGNRWDDFKNTNLARSVIFIQYIIRLDEHGNVVEKLFDRDTDMPKPMPELETGMFVRMADRANWRENTIAYVDHQNNRLIAKEGWFETLSRKDEWQYLRIVEVFSKNVCCFDQCVDNRVIWRSPEYQAYLDSKSN